MPIKSKEISITLAGSFWLDITNSIRIGDADDVLNYVNSEKLIVKNELSFNDYKKFWYNQNKDIKMKKSFKIGGKEYDIKKGDYLLDNESSIQFKTGDGRILYRKKWDTYNYIELNKTALKQFDLSSMECVQVSNQWGNHKRYLFND